MLNLSHLLISVQAIFLKKNISNNDFWSEIFLSHCENQDFRNSHPSLFNPNKFAILHQMSYSLNIFKNLFNNLKGNIFKSSIVYNDLIRDHNNRIVVNFFSNDNWNAIKADAANFTLDSFLIRNDNNIVTGIASKFAMENRWNITLENDEYQSLLEILNLSLVKFGARANLKSECFFKFLVKKSTTSKKLRALYGLELSNIKNASYTKYFTSMMKLPKDFNIEIYSSNLGMWNKCFINYELSNFLFAFTHNQIFTKDRLCKFNTGMDRTCSFCNRWGPLPPQSESFIHSFFYCIGAKTYIRAYENLTNFQINEKKYFLGYEDISLSKDINFTINVDLGILKFFINKIRLESTSGALPPEKAFLTFLAHYQNRMGKISKKYGRNCLYIRQKFYRDRVTDIF